MCGGGKGGNFMPSLVFSSELLNATVCAGIFIYKGTEMKLGSVCRADHKESNDVQTLNLFLCVDPPFAQKLYREQYFRTCTLGATYARVGDGRIKKAFFKISRFEQQIEISQ